MPNHMQIPNTPPRIQYLADGTQTVFPFPFPVKTAGHLQVLLDSAPQNSGFTVTGAGQTNGGTVTFTTAPAAGLSVTLYREVPIERMTDFLESGPLSADSLNDELDNLASIAQQLNESQGRMLKYPVSDPSASTTLPSKIQRASKVLAFDENGNPTAFAAAQSGGQDTFLPPGAGAVERTLAGKAIEIISAKDFGAVGDGVADDTLALQRALAAADAIYLPAGSYRVTSPLVVDYGKSLFGVGQRSVIKGAAGTDPVIELPSSYATVRDLKIEGGTVGIKLHGRLGPCVQNAVTDVAIWDCQYGIVLDGKDSPSNPCYWNNFDRVLVARPLIHGVWLRKTGAGDTPNANRFHALRVYSLGAATTGYGIYVEHGRYNNSFFDCEVNLHTTVQGCVRVGANTEKNLFVNLYTETLGVISNIILDAGSIETVIMNLLSASAGPAIEDHSGGQYTAFNAGYPDKNRLLATRITSLTVESLRYDTDYTEPPTGGTIVLDTSSSIRLISAYGGEVTAQLPAAGQANGQSITIKKVDGSINPITIVENSGSGPDRRTFVLGNQYDFVTVVSNGANWWTVASNNMPGNARYSENQSAVIPTMDQNLYTVSAWSGPVSFELPEPGDPKAVGRTITVKKVDPSGNIVTVWVKSTGSGPDGSAATLTQQGKAITIMSDGASWHILGRY